jgi:hypothetical protein
MKTGSNTTLITNLGSTSATTNINLWSNPERLDVIETIDSIEFIYKETSMVQLAIYPPRPPQERVFKIVFSCINGIWNKSERIYGEIIPQESERYVF